MQDLAHIKGLSDLDKMLNSLPAKVEANVLRGGLRVGAKVFEQEVQKNIPEQTGRLKKSVRVSVRMRRGVVVATVKVGGRSKETQIITVDGRPKMVYVRPFYAHMVEFGTAAHRIKPKNRKMLSFGGGLLAYVDHPGTKPQPFMRPAFDGKHQAALQAFADYARKRLPRELRKVR